MKRKVLATLLCVAMAGTMLVGCGGGDDAAESKESTEAPAETEDAAEAEDTAEGEDAAAESSGGPYTFGYTCMDGTNPFFVTIEGALREAVEAKGDK